jgi:HD superfamily phosphohydrolase
MNSIAIKSREIDVWDPIYKLSQIPEYCMSFINTPEFQRLKYIKQLGVAYHIFPSAMHTRYEHSIGVLILSLKLFRYLLKNSDEKYQLYEKYEKCIALGALLHDVGHIAFSHLFQDALNRNNRHFNHEEHSIQIIKKINDEYALLDDEEVDIIEAIIQGKKLPGYPPVIFEIVANKDSGLDTDKMDYLVRDAYHIGISLVDVETVIQSCKIDNNQHICFAKSGMSHVRAIFAMRLHMFETIYYNEKVNHLSDQMSCALLQIPINETGPFKYVSWTDDDVMHYLRYEIKHDIITCLDYNTFTHHCDKCPDSEFIRVAKLSGDVDGDPSRFVLFYK